VSVSGDVIRPGDLKCVPNEGMPVYRSPFQKGKLIVQFQVRNRGGPGGRQRPPGGLHVSVSPSPARR